MRKTLWILRGSDGARRPVRLHGARAVAGWGYAFVLVMSLAWLFSPVAYGADSALTIVGADNLDLRVTDVSPTKGSKDMTGTLTVTLLNPSTVTTRPKFSLVSDGTASDCPSELTLTSSLPVKGQIAPGEHHTFELEFAVPEPCIGRPASLLVDARGNFSTATAAVSTARDIEFWDYGVPLLFGAIAGILFAASTSLIYRNEVWHRTPRAKSWSFSGSWLTSISALSAALGGVLAATGFVSELLPGVPLGHFLGISLTFAGLLVAAPMVFSVFQVTEWEAGEVTDKDPNPDAIHVVNGTVLGLIAAGSLTCAGLAGQLVMLGRLALLSRADDASTALVVVLLGAVALVAAAYVVASTRQAVQLSEPEAPAGSDTERLSARLTTKRGAEGFTGTF